MKKYLFGISLVLFVAMCISSTEPGYADSVSDTDSYGSYGAVSYGSTGTVVVVRQRRTPVRTFIRSVQERRATGSCR